ncbi:uncharacterized protein METZ01_LOCUS280349 [marine metagenome]|uniref:Phosphohistidine phosphatase SixA n=1 Tax=marine metagenome TaxID=408172 RepID=A0A382KVA3_9ZZZZ|tara:strand:- start:153 stop:644 length:492 start_codon:yes stop_codon:yes gene_type:complete
MNFNLLLVRHAKSSWSNTSLADFDRPLNKRGVSNAPLMGQRIREYGLHLDAIITSTAERAQETSKLIAKEMAYEIEDIDLESDLYHASREVFINILSKQQNRNIAMVGHNPGIQDFSYWLSSEPTVNFPTCGVIHISFSLDNWTEISKNSGKAMRFEYPKMFT